MTTAPSIGRRITKIAIPAIATLSAEPIYQLVDAGIIGHLGATPLAALGVAYAVLTLPYWMTGFIQRVVTTQTARATAGLPEEQRRKAETLADGLAVAIVLGLAVAVTVALLARPLCFALNGRGAVLDGAVQYLRIGVWGMPFLLVSFVGHGLLQGSGRTSRSLLVVAVANVLNIVLELWFVRGLDWGLRGSAWGTLIAQAVTASWLLWFILAERRKPGARGTADWRRMRRIVVDGLRFGVRTFCIAGTFLLTTATATRMGTVRAAAHQIVLQLFYLSALILDGLALAGQVLVAEQLGAVGKTGKDESGAMIRRLVWITLWLGAAIGAIFAFGAGVMPGVFSPEGPVRSAAVIPMILLGALSIPGAIAFLYDGVFVGTNDVGQMVRSALQATVLFVPFGIVSLVWPGTGLSFIWFGLLLWMCARAYLHHRKAVASGWLARV